MSGMGKQAKVLSKAQERAALVTARNDRDRLMVLLSVHAGLRAKEIACLTWSMVTDAEGAISGALALPNSASKGKTGGRTIPLSGDLVAALRALQPGDGRIVRKVTGSPLTANAVAVFFHRLYRSLGFEGASSHSGRRTFITRAARKIVEAGGSLRDVQQLAGHGSLSMTQLYIEGSEDAKRRVVDLICGG